MNSIHKPLEFIKWSQTRTHSTFQLSDISTVWKQMKRDQLVAVCRTEILWSRSHRWPQPWRYIWNWQWNILLCNCLIFRMKRRYNPVWVSCSLQKRSNRFISVPKRFYKWFQMTSHISIFCSQNLFQEHPPSCGYYHFGLLRVCLARYLWWLFKVNHLTLNWEMTRIECTSRCDFSV